MSRVCNHRPGYQWYTLKYSCRRAPPTPACREFTSSVHSGLTSPPSRLHRHKQEPKAILSATDGARRVSPWGESATTASKHIVVTGCAGFIGFHLALKLAEEGHLVHGVDGMAGSYYGRELKQWRLDELGKCSSFTFDCCDIRDPLTLKTVFGEAFPGRPVDAVFHLAALANVRDSVIKPGPYYESNVLGTLNLLEVCREFGIRRFILASTSSVYGGTLDGPTREDADSSSPFSPYGASKVAAEAMLHSYHHLFGIDSTVLRYFTVYGPAGRPDMSVLAFIQAIHEGRPIAVYGDGTQRRDFVYVDDVVRGTLASLPLTGYQRINLGYGQPHTLNEVIGTIEDALGRTAKVRYEVENMADPETTCADISLAKTLLGWSPSVALEDGIRRTLDWYLSCNGWKGNPAGVK